MAERSTRRETLKKVLAAAGLLATVETWTPAVLGQSGADVQFTDIPENFAPGSSTARSRILDIRKIDGLITPKDQFFAVQHFGRPEVDPATYRLKITGMVKQPEAFSLADLRAMRPTELNAGFECSGNSGRSMQGLSSNGRWTGVPLSSVLKKAGVHSEAREVVFFGTDRGVEDVVFRQQTFKLEQQFGRSMTLENAMKPDLLLAFSLNGEPLTREQGFPLRLIVPGWYGVAREMACRSSSAGRPLSRKLSGSLVPISARRGRIGRGGRSAGAMGGNGSYANAAEVGDRAREEDRRIASGLWLCVERWHAAQVS